MKIFIKELFYSISQAGWVMLDKLETGVYLGIGFACGMEVYKVLIEVFK